MSRRLYVIEERVASGDWVPRPREPVATTLEAGVHQLWLTRLHAVNLPSSRLRLSSYVLHPKEDVQGLDDDLWEYGVASRI